MNTYRFSEEQRQSWVMDKYTRKKTVRKICTEAGISRATLYNWMKEFPEPELAEEEMGETAVTRVRDEAAFPKHDLSSKYEMIISALAQADKERHISRKLVQIIVKRYTLSVAQACAIVGMDEAAYGYKPRKPEVGDTLVHDELARLTHEDPSRGFIDCYKLLQQSHPGWTRKQIKRVYREKRLYLRRIRVRKTKTETAAVVEQYRLHRYGTVWNAGMLLHEKSWVLFILDEQDGMPLNAISGEGTPTENDLIAFFIQAMNENGKPRKLRLPGTEPFNAREVNRWIWEHKAALQILNLAKPENEEEIRNREDRVRAEITGAAPSGESLGDLAEAWVQRGVNAYRC